MEKRGHMNTEAKNFFVATFVFAATFAILILAGFVIGFANPAGMHESSVKLYNTSGIEIGNSLLPKQNFSNTYNEGESITLRINVSDGAGLDTVPDRNITKINITFDQSFVVTNYTFNISNGNISTYNVSGNGQNYFFNKTSTLDVNSTMTLLHINKSLTGNTFHWLNTTENGLLGNNTISSNNQSFYFVTFNDVPGTYNITVILQNGTGTSADSTASRNFTIRINDTTVPDRVTLNSNSTGFSSITPIYSAADIPTTTSKVNLSTSATSATTIYVSINATDFNETGAGGIGYAGQAIMSGNFSIYNDTGWVNSSLVTRGTGVNVATLDYNFTSHRGSGTLQQNLTDGNYMIVVKNITDIGGNRNFTVLTYNVTIDGTLPTLTIAKSGSSTSNKIILDITVSDATSGINGKQCIVTGGGTDGIVVSGNTGTQTATQEGLGCNTAYTYTVSCTDHSGNTKSSDTTVNTDSCSGGGSSSSSSSSSSSGTTWENTFVEDSEELSIVGSVTKELGANERIKLKVGGETHHVGIASISSDKVTIEVASDPQQKELSVGESAKFDVTADGTYDLKVTLNSIEGSKADITVEYIQEEIPETPTTEGEDGAGAESAGLSGGAWAAIIIVIIIIIAAVVFWVRKNK